MLLKGGYMNKESPEYERVREEIAKWLHNHTVKVRQESKPWLEKAAWEDLPKEYRIDIQKGWRERADEILSIKGIEIQADSQEPPTRYSADVEQMLKVGFVKVIQ